MKRQTAVTVEGSGSRLVALLLE